MEESILPINLVCFYKWSPFLMACLLNRDDLWCKYKEILCCVCFSFLSMLVYLCIISLDGVKVAYL